MSYRDYLHLRCDHPHFPHDKMPVTIVATDPGRLIRAGLKVRGYLNEFNLFAGGDAPDAVSLALYSEDPVLPLVSPVRSTFGTPVIGLTVQPDERMYTIGEDQVSGWIREEGVPAFAYLYITLPSSADCIDLTLNFATIETLWTYHLVTRSAPPGLRVIDPAGEVVFDDLGQQALHDGSSAWIYRSQSLLPSVAAPQHNFRLDADGPDGPRTIIEVLPGAGTAFRAVEGSGEGGDQRLQSDIYVYL